MATVKKPAKSVRYTEKQIEAIKKSIRSAIRLTTKQIERPGMSGMYADRLKKLRKKLQDANEYCGWSVETLSYNPAYERKRK